MPIGAITGHIDVALVALYVFWAFFFGLVYWLRREDQREGYLLETHKGDPLDILVPPVPPAKTYYLADGTTKLAPDGIPDTRHIAATPTAPWEGAPLEPTGDPIVDGIGAAAWATRRDEPERDHLGQPKIVPLRAFPGCEVVDEDDDPRGMKVLGRGGKIIGKVRDLWVDRAEVLIRYFEVDLTGLGEDRTILVPVHFADMNPRQGTVKITVIGPEHFKLAPTLKNPDVVTKLEEDKVGAFFAGASVYAAPSYATVAP